MLYGTCSQKADRAPIAILYYRAERGTNGHILLSVHGFDITSYLQSLLADVDGKRPPASRASEAAIGRRHAAHTEQACGTDTALGWSSGHGLGVLAGRFVAWSSEWAIYIMS